MQEAFANQQTIPMDMYSGNNIPPDEYINSSHGIQVNIQHTNHFVAAAVVVVVGSVNFINQ